MADKKINLLYTSPATLREIGKYLSLALAPLHPPWGSDFNSASARTWAHWCQGLRDTSECNRQCGQCTHHPWPLSSHSSFMIVWTAPRARCCLLPAPWWTGSSGSQPDRWHQARYPVSTCSKQQKHRTQYATRQHTVLSPWQTVGKGRPSPELRSLHLIPIGVFPHEFC